MRYRDLPFTVWTVSTLLFFGCVITNIVIAAPKEVLIGIWGISSLIYLLNWIDED
jgi:hypothetical protein